MHSDFSICLSELFSFAYLSPIHHQSSRTHIPYPHNVIEFVLCDVFCFNVFCFDVCFNVFCMSKMWFLLKIQKSFLNFFFNCNKKFRSMCLHCFIDDINNLNEIEWCWIENHKSLYFNFVFDDKKHAICKKCNKMQRYDRVLHTFNLIIDFENLEISTMSSKNWNLIKDFCTKFDKIKRIVYDICNKRRFNIKFKKQSMCDRCWRDVKKYFVKFVIWKI